MATSRKPSSLAIQELLSSADSETWTKLNNAAYESLLPNSLETNTRKNLRVRMLLGQGSYAFVYKVLHENQPLALKWVSYSKTNPKLANLEAETMKALTGAPNIVQFYFSVNLPNSSLYIGMEYMKLGTLREFLNNSYKPFLNEQLCWSVRMNLIVDTTRGVYSMHKNQVIHGDLKAENIFVTIDNEKVTAKIGDFGFACFVRNARNRRGFFSPLWSPPEIFLETRTPTLKSDIYSLGTTLWEVVTATHELPYFFIPEMETNEQLADHLMYATPSPKQQIRRQPFPTDCPRLLRDAIGQCWFNDPAKRIKAKNLLAIAERVKEDITPKMD